MSLVFVNVSKNLSFVDLTKLIEQQEELLGPLRTIGPSTESTVLGFDFAEEPPPSPSRIMFAQEGPPSAEHELVARGGAYVLGHLVEVIAYRLKESPQRIAP